MNRFVPRFGLLVAIWATLASPASAQINWNITYTGSGWNDSTPIGSTTVGLARQGSVVAATNYLNTIVDGRGTVNITLTGSLGGSGNPLAFFGPNKFSNIAGSFQNGGVYQAARTNQTPFSGADGSGTFFFGYGWNYAGQAVNPSNFDMTTVAIHEITHGLGFLSNTFPDGTGLIQTVTGIPDLYSEYDKSLQRGNGTGGALINSDITSTNYGTFVGSASTFTNGNNATTGLFFGGKYTREVFGGPAPLYAPNPYEDGSSVSHVNDSNAVMNPDITPNTVRRFQRYEIAMLMDTGWNVYNWKNTTGNFGDGISNLSQSKWQTDQGIASDGTTRYNTHANQGQAPVLPPYGQVTSNIVLNFGGSGSSQYTATNDLGNLRLVRLNLNSSSSQTNTIAGGSLQFGVNSDGTSSVLTPKITQQNTGAFNITSDLVITNTTAALGGGWTGLTVDGAGSGKVSLGGVISGTGTLTKSGAFALEVNGTSANTYTGITTVNGGILLANKSAGLDAVPGDLTIATGGIVRLAAPNQLQGDGTAKTLTLSGGTLSTGLNNGTNAGFSDTLGTLKLSASSTIELGTGSHILRFTGLTGTPTGTLTITDWTGTVLAPGTSGELLFSGIGLTPNADHADFLSTLQFQGFSAGATFLATGDPTVFELVPVPEPATVLALSVAALGIGAFVRRRRSRQLSVIGSRQLSVVSYQ